MSTAIQDVRARQTNGRAARAVVAHEGQVTESSRTTIHRSALAHVEHCARAGIAPAPAGYETHYQIALTYAGLFAYSAGHRKWLIDAGRLLFVSPGWEFEEEHPREVGHAAVLLSPSRELLDEICGQRGPGKNSAFVDTSRPSPMRLRLLIHQILNLAPDQDDVLFKEEWVVRVLEHALDEPVRGKAQSSRIVERAKELLHARFDERLCLQHIASEIGVAPAYLTQEFTRCEGTPLYRYQLRLRLTRALSELPHCEDITDLALDLGFSSHSHFTSVFRKTFGLTPSAYRSAMASRRSDVMNRFQLPNRSRRVA